MLDCHGILYLALPCLYAFTLGSAGLNDRYHCESFPGFSLHRNVSIDPVVVLVIYEVIKDSIPCHILEYEHPATSSVYTHVVVLCYFLITYDIHLDLLFQYLLLHIPIRFEYCFL